MRVNTVNQVNFGRAFTTKEKSDYKKLIADCKKELGIKDTTAIAFDFTIPSEEGKNMGIGSTWSDSMKHFITFVKDMTGITSIQLQPQGKISIGNKSPYSGTNFAYGEHIISLDKLTQKEYGKLLSEERILKIDEQYQGDKITREYKTDYNYVLGENGVQEVALKEAFDNFQKGKKHFKPNILRLNREFEQFKKENADWLQAESEFALFVKHYGTDDFSKWDNVDVNLNKSFVKNSYIAKKRVEELKAKYGDDSEYNAFVQFIADKQQKESHEFLKSQKVKVYGDCLIGFSPSEMWGNLDAFKLGQYYGGPDPNCTETNGVQAWGLPAINYDKLVEDKGFFPEIGASGKLLLEKYKKFFERYDGVRVDAAWQFITPFVYEEKDGKIEQVNIRNKDKNTFFEILDKAKRDVFSTGENIMLELVGLSAGESRDLTMNKYPHLYTTAYAEYDENPTAFIKKGYKPDKFYVGVGCHDNDSLVNQANDDEKRKQHLSDIKKHFPTVGDIALSKENFRKFKFAELFTVPKQFFTLSDMFGMSERINTSGVCNDDNWTVRIPKDYEKFYFSQLANGYGLNMPETLKTALVMKDKQGKRVETLIDKCNEASKILLEDGPMTEQEANKLQKENKLNNIFSY